MILVIRVMHFNQQTETNPVFLGGEKENENNYERERWKRKKTKKISGMYEYNDWNVFERAKNIPQM